MAVTLIASAFGQIETVGVSCKLDVPAPDDFPGKVYFDGLAGAVNSLHAAGETTAASIEDQLRLADLYTTLWCFGFLKADDALPQAKRATRAALKLDPKSGEARLMSAILALSEWNWKQAEISFQEAIDSDDTSAKAHHWYALFLAAMSQPDEARAQTDRAVELSSTSGYRTGRGAVLYFARDYPEMIREMSATIQLDPTFAPGYDWLGMAYVQQQRFDEAIDVYRKAVQFSSNLAEIKAGLGHAYGRAGRTQEAQEVLDELLRLEERYYIPPVQMAFVHLSLGQRDLALECLRRAMREHSWELVFLNVEPWMDDLRGDAAFETLIAKLRFPKSDD